MRVLTIAAVLALGAAGVGAWLVQTEPDLYLRARYPLEYEHIIRDYAGQHDLDPDLLAAVVYAESRFDPNASSEAGAIGLMQLMPETAQFIARKTGGTSFVLADLRDPEINIRYGAWLLDYHRDRYGDERTALAAYHAGPGNVDEWRRNDAEIVFPETQAYVREVERVRRVYAKAYGHELGL